MARADDEGPTGTDRGRYHALLAVSEAIVAHRDLSTLFHELAGRLQQVVRFDYLGLLLHDAASNTLRLHVLESTSPLPSAPLNLPLAEVPAGLVWQTQQPLIVPDVAKEK